jgi:hypothetical protein
MSFRHVLIFLITPTLSHHFQGDNINDHFIVVQQLQIAGRTLWKTGCCAHEWNHIKNITAFLQQCAIFITEICL